MQGQWIQHPQQNKTVIFVHGILSSSESGWTYKKGVFWFKKRVAWFNLLKDEEELKGLGIYTFSYNTGIFSGTYSLNDVVTAFKEQLKLDKVLQSNKQLIFVCHSMGGIVVRKFIVERQMDLINLNLQIGLFLVASPSLGAEYANLINGFAKKLNHTQADALRFNQNNIWLNDLDNQFMNFKEARYLPLIGKELVEDKFVIKKLFFIPQIVQPFSGARYFGEHLRVANSDHFSIAKPKDKKAIQHRLLCEFIKEFAVTIENNYPKPTESNNTIAEQSIEQSVTHSTAENIVCAEQVNGSFNKTEIDASIYVEGNVSGGYIAGHNINITNNIIPQKVEVIPEIDTDHLPKPTTALIGRKIELTQLTERFTDGKTRLAIIVAAGGIGKSALTYEWLTQIETENYYGKTRVFGWSFYSQGSHNTFTNSQPFFSAVLPFLGISDIPKDEIEKARLLARCLQQQPCLLILDGLEPLQYAENLQSMNGELQDSALKEFILQFRQKAGKSFVLLSSRQPLVELDNWDINHYLNINLERLTENEGVLLLKQRLISFSDDELKEISRKLAGHALSLVLFGCLLSQHRKTQESWRKVLKLDEKEYDNNEFHTFDVLECYWKELDEYERTFLQLLGLFDRPMNAAEKAVLIANANHAEPLRDLTAKPWQAVEQRLEKSGLLLGKKGSFVEYLEWDTHPIIRAYFGGKFKENYPEEFKQAHFVLFEYYQKLPEKELPDTREEMKPLYLAVKHGCLAGEYYKADFDIYWKRIRRGNEGYSTNNLGLYSDDLGALSAFFSLNWDKLIATGLSEENQAWLLSTTSFCLMSLGHFSQAVITRLENLKLREKQENWENASKAAQTLVDVYLPLGQLLSAHDSAQKALEYAELSRDTSRRVECECYLATVHYHYGQFNQALKYFQQAEKSEQEDYLISGYGFDYCALLLESSQDNTDLKIIKTRAEYSLKIDKALLSIALDYLTLARFYIASKNEFSNANNYFQQAIQNIQKANRIDLTPPFYLYRADFYLTQNQLDPALADLNSAWEIIERCGMKLYAVDYLLIHGRYSLATADVDTALNHYQEAKQLIEETGYHLRDAELDLFAAQICLNSESKLMSLDSKNADYYLQKAKNRIAEIGQWGLMRVIERDFPNG